MNEQWIDATDMGWVGVVLVGCGCCERLAPFVSLLGSRETALLYYEQVDRLWRHAESYALESAATRFALGRDAPLELRNEARSSVAALQSCREFEEDDSDLPAYVVGDVLIVLWALQSYVADSDRQMADTVKRMTEEILDGVDFELAHLPGYTEICDPNVPRTPGKLLSLECAARQQSERILRSPRLNVYEKLREICRLSHTTRRECGRAALQLAQLRGWDVGHDNVATYGTAPDKQSEVLTTKEPDEELLSLQDAKVEEVLSPPTKRIALGLGIAEATAMAAGCARRLLVIVRLLAPELSVQTYKEVLHVLWSTCSDEMAWSLSKGRFSWLPRSRHGPAPLRQLADMLAETRAEDTSGCITPEFLTEKSLQVLMAALHCGAWLRSDLALAACNTAADVLFEIDSCINRSHCRDADSSAVIGGGSSLSVYEVRTQEACAIILGRHDRPLAERVTEVEALSEGMDAALDVAISEIARAANWKGGGPATSDSV